MDLKNEMKSINDVEGQKNNNAVNVNEQNHVNENKTTKNAESKRQ